MDQNFSNWTAAKLRTYLDWMVHAVTVWRHLSVQGWRWRRPALRVTSRDPRYTAKRRCLQSLRRQARCGDVHLCFVDEMDLALLPTVSSCWRPMCQQRQVATPGQNFKEYLLGAVTGALVWLVWPCKNNVGFRELLKRLLAEHEGDTRPIVVVADNFRIHKAKVVLERLTKVRDRLRVWFLPTYSPQLNPLEWVWRHCRRSVTDHIYFKTMKRSLNAMSKFLNELAVTPASMQRLVVARFIKSYLGVPLHCLVRLLS